MKELYQSSITSKEFFHMKFIFKEKPLTLIRVNYINIISLL